MTKRSRAQCFRRWAAATVLPCALLAALAACRSTETGPRHRTFGSPEEAVGALIQAVKGGDLNAVLPIFGPDAQALVDASDPVTGRRNREIFTAAVAEQWRLEDRGTSGKTLDIGYEDWPFPIPLVKEGIVWRFDTAAGKEEILARRIGRNELTVIRICRTYVTAQRIYARSGHDGEREGLYARSFRSDPGRQNGLYWAAARGEKRSPLGDLVALAAEEGTVLGAGGPQPSPFHGYYFKILTAQGPAAAGGATDYLVDGRLSRGFALVAWPALYNVTGITTFIVNHDGIVHETDLGDGTEAAARAITAYNPDASWSAAQ